MFTFKQITFVPSKCANNIHADKFKVFGLAPS